MKSWVGGWPGRSSARAPEPGGDRVAGGHRGRSGRSGRVTGLTGVATSGIASGAGPTAWAGSMPSGRCASSPGGRRAPGRAQAGGGPLPGRASTAAWCRVDATQGLAAGRPSRQRGRGPAAPPSCTNLVTCCASAADPAGVVALPASCDAAASNSCCGRCGVAAACWITGLRFCTASRPAVAPGQRDGRVSGRHRTHDRRDYCSGGQACGQLGELHGALPHRLVMVRAGGQQRQLTSRAAPGAAGAAAAAAAGGTSPVRSPAGC